MGVVTKTSPGTEVNVVYSTKTRKWDTVARRAEKLWRVLADKKIVFIPKFFQIRVSSVEKMKYLLCSLFASCLLFAGLARGCEWDQSVEENQGLDLTSEEAELTHTDLVSEANTLESCRAACCNKPDCDLALIGYPMDGGPQCMLVRCWINGRDVCVITPSTQFKIYRKQVERETRGKATDGGEKLRAVPLVGTEEAKSNDSNNSKTPRTSSRCLFW